MFIINIVRYTFCVIDLIPPPINLYTHRGWHISVLYFCISTLRIMCAVPNMAVYCSFLTSWFPGMLLIIIIIIITIIIIIIIIIIVYIVRYLWFTHTTLHKVHVTVIRCYGECKFVTPMRVTQTHVGGGRLQ